MSVRKQALKYTAAALAVAALIIVSSTFFLSPTSGNGGASQTNTTGVQGGTQASLIIQLADPPVVPTGTTYLNLTYSSVTLLVSEPASHGGLTTVSVSPPGGSATVDLLELGALNVSQTVASTNLPNGSLIKSFAFTVTSISIDVNSTTSQVTLATGGSTVTVNLAEPAPLDGNSVALLQLNPIIVSTPTGYQMWPSTVGIVRAATGSDLSHDKTGDQQHLTSEDESQLQSAQGNLTANLSAFSVSGNTTTISVKVNNIGNASVVLNAIGFHGNFTRAGTSCTPSSNDNSTSHSSDGGAPDSPDSNTTTTATSTTTSAKTSQEQSSRCETETPDQVIFAPVNSTVTGTGCVSLKMQLVSGDIGESGAGGLTLAPGQCVDLTFTGTISFGQSGLVLVPSTLAHQVYTMHIIASLGANAQLSCNLPVTATSCSASNQAED
ncbi:MAG: hypothetical protein JRN21_02155 [Nitrososphaerota archaeon]|nr:hypothetical protein [Nitrososphaerota archaeon]